MTKYRVLTGLTNAQIDRSLPKSSVEGSALAGMNAWLSSALSAEPESLDPSERGPVTGWIGSVFGNPRMTKTEALTKLPLEPGDPSPFHYVFDSIASEGGQVVTLGNAATDFTEIEPVRRDKWRTPEYAAALVFTGGDAIDLPVWFEFDDPTAECPFSSSQEDWQTWGTEGGNHLPRQYGAKWYRSSAVGMSGVCMPASQWVPAWSAGQCSVISEAAYRQIKLEHTPEI